MISTCLLVLLGICSRPVTRAQTSLNIAAVAATFADIGQTEVRLHLPNPAHEFDPLARPFVNHGYAVAYASGAVETLTAAWLGQRMKNSGNRVVRRLWRLPQALEIGGHIAGLVVSARS